LSYEEHRMSRDFNTPTLKVMMVDDSVMIVTRVECVISELQGIKFMGNSASISAAIELVRLAGPDVVILDINLGSENGKNGINLLNLLRQLYPEITFIMLTNLSGDRYRALCKHYGAEYFLDKSNDFEKIPEILATIRDSRNSPN
jgi:DNA-binding NarL/FixJ family response regulator